VLTNNANSNTVEGNYIGLRADGGGTLANLAGVQIFGSSNNIIGGAVQPTETSFQEMPQREGLTVTNVAAPGANLIANNYIGLDDDGMH
jgi:hypothetical protein